MEQRNKKRWLLIIILICSGIAGYIIRNRVVISKKRMIHIVGEDTGYCDSNIE